MSFEPPPPEIVTPDALDTRLGPLEFVNGAPTDDTVEKVDENLNFTHALNVFLNCYGVASLQAIVEGQRTVAEDGTFLVFSELMDASSLFLTANCDTIYCLTVLDLAAALRPATRPRSGPPRLSDIAPHLVAATAACRGRVEHMRS
jgi:hypothetical protein